MKLLLVNPYKRQFFLLEIQHKIQRNKKIDHIIFCWRKNKKKKKKQTFVGISLKKIDHFLFCFGYLQHGDVLKRQSVQL
jgi:hypothetical protein